MTGVALARPEVAQRRLLARVDPSGDTRWRLDELRGHGFTKRIIGRTHVPGELNMGHIERFADFVVATGLAILRQFGSDLCPRNPEKVPNRVLVFVGVETTESCPGPLGNRLTFVCGECGIQAIDKLREEAVAGRGMPAGGISPAETRS